MKRTIWRDLFILSFGFGLIWLTFSYLPVFPKKSDLTLSTQKENKIGENLIKNLLHDSNTDSINNETIQSDILSIYKQLEKNIDNKKFDYNFIIIKNNEINAFALPGGYIVFFTGLIQFCETPEELSAIMAHEIGHIENRHLISRLLKNIGIELLLSGDNSVIGEVSHIAIESVFDRKQEKEADQYAFNLLKKSGISPRVVSSFFRKLENEGKSFNKNIELLMSHPHNIERIKAALQYPLDSNFTERKIDIDFLNMKKQLSLIHMNNPDCVMK
jgi:predicted Zn-dependent protease